MPPALRSLYDIIEVEPSCSAEELRAAYRLKARALHPDVSADDNSGHSMAELNDAWRQLSDPKLRAAYDREQTEHHETTRDQSARTQADSAQHAPGSHFGANPATKGFSEADRVPPPSTSLSRRQAWVIGVQAQVTRLATMAGRSSSQTLLLRTPRGDRAAYEKLVLLIVQDLEKDTEARVRAARAAGAAPLDLGVGATLVGIRTLADQVRRQGSLGIDDQLLMTAELLDRMWDVLAHELPNTLEVSLGSNPQVAKTLTR